MVLSKKHSVLLQVPVLSLVFKKWKTCSMFLSPFSINLAAFYHECEKSDSFREQENLLLKLARNMNIYFV